MRARRLGLRFVALGYLALLIAVPVGLVLWRTFEHGIAPAWDAVTSPDAAHAFWLTLEIVAIAVPLTTIFGVATALLLARRQFRGRALLDGLIDLPFAVS
ncbi:MAG: sulfate ABC transporter, partial [Thermoleophilaceae bacterium]